MDPKKKLESRSRKGHSWTTVRISLGWMDARAWYQIAVLINMPYYKASSQVSRMKNANVIYIRKIIYGTYGCTRGDNEYNVTIIT
jgi:hypothetical protein